MAIFIQAFKKTESSEGQNVWTKIDGDSGGETWSGISRRANPSWGGWKIIDSIPNKKNKQVISNNQLESLKQQLYKKNYWDTFRGDSILNQNVANDLYDTAVNMGVKTSIKLSQRQFKLSETGVMDDILLNKLNLVK